MELCNKNGVCRKNTLNNEIYRYAPLEKKTSLKSTFCFKKIHWILKCLLNFLTVF